MKIDRDREIERHSLRKGTRWPLRTNTSRIFQPGYTFASQVTLKLVTLSESFCESDCTGELSVKFRTIIHHNIRTDIMLINKVYTMV